MAGIVYDMIPKTAVARLEEFSDAFKGALALGDVTIWADLGLSVTSSAIKTTYPLPIYAAGYNEFKGEFKYRTMFTRSLSMKPRVWQDGVEELAAIVEAGDFIGWLDQPAAMALEAQRLPNQLVAEMLEANPYLGLYKDDEELGATVLRRLFAADHPNNIFESSAGTFDNDDTAATIQEAVTKGRAHFRSIKGPNGKSMGLQMTHLVVPPQLEEAARDFLENDLLIEAVTNVAGTENIAAVTRSNRFKGTVTLVVADELTDDDMVYALSLNKPGMAPWIVQTNGAPEEIVQDKDSHLYKASLSIAVAYVIQAAVAAALPHAIVRYQLP